MKELDKETLLKEIPDLFYTLRFKYGFYFNGFITNINKDILEVVKAREAKNKHKIVIYNRNNRLFIVVYKKNGPDIYYCNEYRDDENDSRIKYFARKVRRAYQKAEDDYADTLYSAQMDNTGRV